MSNITNNDTNNFESMDFDNTNNDPKKVETGNLDASRPSDTIEFTVNNVSKLCRSKDNPKVLSEKVIIRCLPWRVLVTINANEFGIFVQCNADCESNIWSCTAKAKIELLRNDGKESKAMEINHTFCAKENDWGYRSFEKIAEILKPEKGYLTDDSLTILAHIEADAPHGVDWNSKKHTGFVGLKNQGATCYLNSLLQTLYFTNELQRAVFLMPTESDDVQTSVPFALQRLFYELKFSDKPVGTKKLTKSFGWATLDSFMQHDAQELCRVLLDNLENKMKGTSVEKVIPDLFCGKMLSYIRCLHVEYESKREETFYDIQLKVKGNRSVYEAFKEYVEEEFLVNDNRYDAGVHGMQDAKKGVIFTKFPPILYLQLMRFQYDYYTDQNIKVNDYFEFPYELVLDDFLLEKDPNKPAKYFLHAVLVHSGDNYGGHYVVFINPSGENRWYEFDDDVVSLCKPEAAMNMNFGNSSEVTFRGYSNAYMLVYISEAEKERILSPVEEDDIPEYLRERFNAEKMFEISKKKLEESAHRYVEYQLLLEEDFYGCSTLDIVNMENVPFRTIKVLKDDNKTNIVDEIAKVLKRDPQIIDIWIYNAKNNPACFNYFESNMKSSQSLVLFVRFFSQPRKLNVLSMIEKRNYILICKYFDMKHQTCRYCGCLEFDKNETLAEADGKIRKLLDIPQNHSIVLYAQLQGNADIRIFDSENEQIFNFLNTGQFSTTLIVSSASSEKDFYDQLNDECHDVLQDFDEMTDINSKERLHKIDHVVLHKLSLCLDLGKIDESLGIFQNYKLLLNNYRKAINESHQILLVDKNRPSDIGLMLVVSGLLSYWQFAELVGKILNSDPHYLQFFRSMSASGKSLHNTTSTILPTQYGGPVIKSLNGTSDLNDTRGTPSPVSAVGALSLNPANKTSIVYASAKASGFLKVESDEIQLFSQVSQNGLDKEPIGPPIKSNQKECLKSHFEALASSSANQNLVNYNLNSRNSQNSFSQNLGEKKPFPLNRYCLNTESLVSQRYFPYSTRPGSGIRRVYYSHLNIPIEELESMSQLKVFFFGHRMTEEFVVSVILPQDAKVKDLLQQCCVVIPCSENGSGTLRLLETKDSKIIRICNESEKIASLNCFTSDKFIIRVEEVPLDEMVVKEDEIIIFVCHLESETNRTCGVPFTLKIKNHEPFSQIRERIRKRLDFFDKEFERCKFSLLFQNKNTQIPYDSDTKVDISIFRPLDNVNQAHLCIEHKVSKRPRYAPSQKAIKIHN